MTLPDERYRAIIWAKNLCEELLDPKQTPRVPKEIRQQAYSVLRHFPDEYYLSMLAESRPDILERKGDPFDPLYVMVKQYGLSKEKEKE
jgi:tRNA pseudouridine-54 N-methylase